MFSLVPPALHLILSAAIVLDSSQLIPMFRKSCCVVLLQVVTSLPLSLLLPVGVHSSDVFW